MAKSKSTFTHPSTHASSRQKNPVDFWDWFNEGYLGRCTIGGNYIGITENGDYRSCGFHEGYRIGNVKDTKLRTSMGRPAKKRVPPQTTRQKQPQRQMRSLRVPRNLRRMQNTRRILHRRPLRIRPSMQLHPQSASRRPQALEECAKTQWAKNNNHSFFHFLLSFLSRKLHNQYRDHLLSVPIVTDR